MKTSILNNLVSQLWDISCDDVPSTYFDVARERFVRDAKKLIRKAIRDDLKWQDRDPFANPKNTP